MSERWKCQSEFCSCREPREEPPPAERLIAALDDFNPYIEFTDAWRDLTASEQIGAAASWLSAAASGPLRTARSVTELPCVCELRVRRFYEGRDGRWHCEQCDGLMPAERR